MHIKFDKSSYYNVFKHPILGISIHNFIKILFKNKLLINIRFLLKIMFLVMFTLINLPFQLFEYFKYSKKIKKINLKEPIFIIRHPRSGTTYLNNIISRDPTLSFSNTYDVLVPNVFLLHLLFLDQLQLDHFQAMHGRFYLSY